MRAFLTVKILGHSYKFYRVRKVDKNNSSGECNFQRNIIKIKSGQQKTAEAETILHEVLHALDPNLSEVRVHAFAAQLHQVLRDNPKLLDLIFPR